jgi:hypothetical protein
LWARRDSIVPDCPSEFQRVLPLCIATRILHLSFCCATFRTPRLKFQRSLCRHVFGRACDTSFDAHIPFKIVLLPHWRTIRYHSDACARHIGEQGLLRRRPCLCQAATIHRFDHVIKLVAAAQSCKNSIDTPKTWVLYRTSFLESKKFGASL